jgi:hypothetical protein
MSTATGLPRISENNGPLSGYSESRSVCNAVLDVGKLRNVQAKVGRLGFKYSRSVQPRSSSVKCTTRPCATRGDGSAHKQLWQELRGTADCVRRHRIARVTQADGNFKVIPGNRMYLETLEIDPS